jgi:hypothetical protein
VPAAAIHSYYYLIHFLSGVIGLFALHRPPTSGGGSLLPSLARGLSCWEIGICKKQHRTQMLQLPVQRDETKSGLDLSKIFGGTSSFQKMCVNFLKHIL